MILAIAQSHPVETATVEANAVLVVLVEGVHGTPRRCDTGRLSERSSCPSEPGGGRISRATRLARWKWGLKATRMAAAGRHLLLYRHTKNDRVRCDVASPR
jgi:hypothetical protein